jgi:hypothetical protein
MDHEIVLDVRGLIAALGGPVAIGQACLEAGLASPPRSLVQCWKTRRSVPGRWLPTLIYLARRKGVDPINFMSRVAP